MNYCQDPSVENWVLMPPQARTPQPSTYGLPASSTGVPKEVGETSQMFICCEVADCAESAKRLKMLLKKEWQGAKIVLYLSQTEPSESLNKKIRGTRVILALLTKHFFLSEWCCPILRLAITLDKHIVLVQDPDPHPQHGAVALGEIMASAPDDLKFLFDEHVALPILQFAGHTKISIKKIVKEAKRANVTESIAARSLMRSMLCSSRSWKQVQSQYSMWLPNGVETKFDLFISHCQREAQNTVLHLKMLLEKKWPGIRIWLDVQQNPTEQGMFDGIRESRAVLAVQTKSYFLSEWCCKELRWAIDMGKHIVFIEETDARHYSAKREDIKMSAPEDLRCLLDERISVPWIRFKDHLEYSVMQIVEAVKRGPTSLDGPAILRQSMRSSWTEDTQMLLSKREAKLTEGPISSEGLRS